jgi:hypothetical protein
MSQDALPAAHEHPSLTEAAGRRRDLHAALVAMEAAATAPGRGGGWAGRALERLDDLRGAFAAHVKGTETGDGVFADVMARAPHLAHRIDHLRRDHDEITEAGDAAARTLAALTDGDEPEATEAARDELLALITAISRHRQRGAQLVFDAYDVDLSGGD